MNKNWKIPVIGAAGAGVFSFLIGGVFKVSFPLILIRALLFAAITLGLIYLIFFVISKYLSELLSDESSDEEFSQNSSSFGIDQNGGMGVDYDGETDPAGEGVHGARLSGEDISIDLDGDEEVPMEQLGGIESEAGSQVSEAALSSSQSSSYKGGASVEEFLGANHDPEELAKSIRTVLKKDEKGSG